MREGWKVDKIGNYVDLQQGFALNKKSDYHISDVPTQYPLLKISDLINNTETLFVKESIPKQFLIHEHELIFSRTGQVGLIFKGKKGVIYNNCFKIIPNELIDSDYIYYYFKQDYVIENVRNLATGAAQPDLNHSAFKSIDISFPESKETQRKIAKILSNYDDLIENNLKRIKILEEMAQQTYEEWFVRMRFPGYETAKINETTGLPEGWERDLVGNQLDKIKSTTKIKSSEIQKSGLFPVIDQSRDFIAGFTDDRVAVLRYSNTPYIVFGDHTRVLKLINFDFARGADGTQIIKSKNKRMPQHLFYFTLMNIDLSNYHYARHFKYLKDSEIIIPSESIANTFEDLVKLNYDIIFNLQSQNQRLREARDILLPRLMMGLLNVEDIDL